MDRHSSKRDEPLLHPNTLIGFGRGPPGSKLVDARSILLREFDLPDLLISFSDLLKSWNGTLRVAKRYLELCDRLCPSPLFDQDNPQGIAIIARAGKKIYRASSIQFGLPVLLG